jgi:hypothetical protein
MSWSLVFLAFIPFLVVVINKNFGSYSMKTFVADIIPQIQRFSQKLDNLTMLTNQHWVVLDELNLSKTVYIFRANGDLLIAINGKVEKAKWEYLGQNSILIDLKEQSYLFRHGFFDENVLALKIDSKEEYAVLINESKYLGELNSISAVIRFLNQNYLTSPAIANKKLGHNSAPATTFSFVRDGYTLKMGSFKEYTVKFPNGYTCSVFQKQSNWKYFIYQNNEILLFPNKETCLRFVQGELF